MPVLTYGARRAARPHHLRTHTHRDDVVVRADVELRGAAFSRAHSELSRLRAVGDHTKISADAPHTGGVEAHKTAHGSGSDPDHDGFADSFSNVSGSLKSSLGFYLTAEIYDGTHIHSMKLDGLMPDGSPNGMANTNARDRAIVVHEASYVDDTNMGIQGRSSGCPALDPDIEVAVVDRIHGGSLMYIATSPLDTPVGRAPATSSPTEVP